jgi:hypothetical protein
MLIDNKEGGNVDPNDWRLKFGDRSDRVNYVVYHSLDDCEIGDVGDEEGVFSEAFVVRRGNSSQKMENPT